MFIIHFSVLYTLALLHNVCCKEVVHKRTIVVRCYEQLKGHTSIVNGMYVENLDDNISISVLTLYLFS